MHKIKKALIVALLLGAVMPACKKGENDPSISLRSRKARLAGEWKVTSGKGTEVTTYPSGTSNTETWTFNGSTLTTTDDSGSESEARTIEYAFEKDGTFTQTEVQDNYTVNSEGTWDFSGGVGETKSKSILVLSYTKQSDGTDWVTYTGFIPMYDYTLDELRNDKIVLKRSSKRVWDNSMTNEETEEWVLEPK